MIDKNQDKTGLTEEEAALRPDRIRDMEQRFSTRASGVRSAQIRLAAKRMAWLFIIQSAYFIKRAVDIIASAVVLVLLLPLFGVVALSIKATDGGSVFFWQSRVGRHGCEFPFPKFRSMVANAEQLKDKLIEQNAHGDVRTFKMKRDPRVTWIGRVLRKLSIDELPQFWCVLIGQMSLVGPRPPVPREVALYTVADRRRLDVTPGLTCIWQVSGRGDIPFPEQVQLDVKYIESQSFWLDIKLLFLTVPAVLFGKGAY